MIQVNINENDSIRSKLQAVFSISLVFLMSVSGVFACIEPHDYHNLQTPHVSTPSAVSPPAWVALSNENARVLLAVQARFSPESAGQIGIEGLDEKVVDLQPRLRERLRQEIRDAAQTLRARLAVEKDAAVRQDLEILIEVCDDQIRGSQLAEKHNLPYYNVGQMIFNGVRALLDDQVARERRPAALVRLRRYSGLEPGYTPLTELAELRPREKLTQAGLTAPSRGQIEKNLSNTPILIEGIVKLLAKHSGAGYEEAFLKLKEQASAAESATRPSRNMRPPRMVGNTSEVGEFILPLRVPAAAGSTQQFDDFHLRCRLLDVVGTRSATRARDAVHGDD